ncbi:MAG: hypothetical protein P8179_11750 [Candidatus Thiodiazotropha sp.]|jgi:uncharacterized membrane protein
MSIALTFHLLGVIIWVGGIFFSHVVLRPALNDQLEPDLRLLFLLRVFDGFFPWVWGAVIAILGSGFWLMFTRFEDAIPFWLSFMATAGTLMAGIFVFVYAIPYHQFSEALKAGDKLRVVSSITLIRKLILINLGLGMLITLVVLFGKYGLF